MDFNCWLDNWSKTRTMAAQMRGNARGWLYRNQTLATQKSGIGSLKSTLLALALGVLTSSVCMGQTNALPTDLAAIDASDVPTPVYAYWSIANWNVWAPSPDNFSPGSPLYYSPSDTFSNRVIYIDDTESGGFHAMDELSGGAGGGDGGGDPPSPPPFGTNLCLYLSHPDSNWNATLLISNTVTGTPYEIIVAPVVTNALPTWISMGVWPGASGNTTPIPVELPTNSALYFDARVWTLSRFLSQDRTNNQLLLILTNTSSIVALINGVSNNFPPFVSEGSNYVLLDRPLYSVNLGYDASDSGQSNSTTYAGWPEQHIMGVLGYSATLTNLLLSYNPLTNLDVHSFPALQDLECWHCTNLVSANITNCPQLLRICVESCNLTGTFNISGDTNLQELRAASQALLGTQNSLLDDIVFGGAGPHIWHLCAHNNTFTNHFDFTQFPDLQQLWFWDTSQNGPLILNSTNSSTNLTSVEVYNDGQDGGSNLFTTADFHGQFNLTDLRIYGMPTLTNLNITGCSNLTYIDANSDGLPTSVLDSILTNLLAMGKGPGFLNLYGTSNQWPSLAGLEAVTNLENIKGWAVEWNGPPSYIPQISNLQATPGSNTALITWTTQIPSDSIVYYGTNTSYGSSTNGDSDTTNHSASLSGLATNTVYHYYVTSTSSNNVGSSTDNQFLTLGAAQNTNPIYFVCTVAASETLYMDVSNSLSATTNWFWGDGVSNTSSAHTFTNAGTYTNFVVVNPASALVLFGIECGTGNYNLSSVSGLTNYPYLQDLYFYQSGLTNISLAGCSNLVHIALAGCTVNSGMEDGWFTNLWNAEPIMPPGLSQYCDSRVHYFYYPTNASVQPTSASYSSRTNLTNIGWILDPQPN
jgi:hypothetical protein